MTSSWITFQWPWVLIGLVVMAVGALLLLGLARRDAPRRDGGDADAQVWNLDDDMETEYVAAQWRRWRLLNRVAVTLLTLGLIAAVTLAARPSRIDSESSSNSTRDIILCLDVSGSTLPYDREVIATYLDLIQHFQGERIGLSIFNSTSRTVFPLTDDYDLVEKQLSYANTILKGVVDQESIDKMSDEQYQQVSDWLEGTQNRKNVTSLIGDGLVSCAAMLPEFTAAGGSANTNRNASIVLATDNVLSGTPTYQLGKALDLTKRSGIVVDGLYSGPVSTNGEQTTLEMKSQIESHGGTFLTQGGDSSVSALVRTIENQRHADDEKRNQSNLVDAPQYWLPVIVVLFLGFLLTAGRLQR
ncbi:VWA domain-containing protein [Bifidobacterium sp. SMB2]|uniref:VWA domain-containing protein n=1 Tax=Bifidobacterium saimiriisciurei TaxID=2661627 RepID=A0ABX0CGA4_9BIFI|nr:MULTISPECIES: VWA domain-containing protein [Bifidobacterium]NEG95606.1 VWA domain-containing protein [Bifidobacterium sp. SMB2]NEH11919.1 VWA domain-containing protein [Bifidobacterium saimiriisciurei]